MSILAFLDEKHMHSPVSEKPFGKTSAMLLRVQVARPGAQDASGRDCRDALSAVFTASAATSCRKSTRHKTSANFLGWLP